jgi:hypothetical protein
MVKNLFIQPFVSTGKEFGIDLNAHIKDLLSALSVEWVEPCPDGSPCHENPTTTLRQGISALLAALQAQQDLIDALTLRVEALENP